MDGLTMMTSNRHGNILSVLNLEFFGKYRKELISKKFNLRQEEGALVHWGEKKSGTMHLVDIDAIPNKDYFLTEIINDLEYVQPDIMIFKEQPFLTNRKENRTAGFPDLLVEIWSEGNTPIDIKLKMDLYKTAPTTEHWYISQDDNEIECWLGDKQIATQTLTNVLKSQGGIEFDLRDLAL